MSEQAGFAPPPVAAGVPFFLVAGRFHDPENWGESVGTRPDAGVGGRDYLLAGEAKRFSNDGKTVTRIAVQPCRMEGGHQRGRVRARETSRSHQCLKLGLELILGDACAYDLILHLAVFKEQ